MKWNATFRTILLESICLLYVVLFVYAAISKLLEFENFQAQLGQSPLLSAYTGFVSYSVIGVELVIALLICFPKTRYIGLLSALGLMVLFTAYIVIILNYSYFVPCSCGGILESLGWKEHLIFNIGFVVLALIGLFITTVSIRKTILQISVIFPVCVLTTVGLYTASERTMHQENPFIRRFIQSSAFKTDEAKLINTSQYFAGSDGNTIYLADHLAPLHITAYDTTLKVKKKFKIELEREDFPFRTVQVKVFPPYFYLMDGTVPIIYRGLLSDWKGKILMKPNGYYFSKAEVTAPDVIAFRAQDSNSGNNVLGTFQFTDSLMVTYARDLLEKQVDGFFDTDGTMAFDHITKKFVYTYYYRNQFVVTDTILKLSYRGKTIDTISHVNFKTAFIKETKSRKMASPSLTVNQLTASSEGLLFINSKIVGRYEPKEMWQQASIVDIYDIQNNTYLSSIYIYHAGKARLQSMHVVGEDLYAIIGSNLHRYHLNKKLIRKKT